MNKSFLTAGLAVALGAAMGVTRVNASADDDKKAVAALDTQYQAAVKANDAPTMDRILADDFILVTGNSHESRPPERGAQREGRLRASERHGTDGSRLG